MACDGDGDDVDHATDDVTASATLTPTVEETATQTTATAQPPVEPSAEPTDTPESGPPPISDVTCNDILSETSAPEGWSVLVGEGAGTFLDVTDETDTLVGYIELLALPTNTFTPRPSRARNGRL